MAVMSLPLNRIRPCVGLMNLVSRLKQVVLPAPFGPISAWILPRRILKPTPRTAMKPANSLVRSSVTRIISSDMTSLSLPYAIAILCRTIPPCQRDLRRQTEAVVGLERQINFLARRDLLIVIDLNTDLITADFDPAFHDVAEIDRIDHLALDAVAASIVGRR